MDLGGAVEQVECGSCRASNPASAAFCGACGAALQPAAGRSQESPSGWALATAGIDQPAPPATADALRTDEYASWGARLGGYLLDGFILSLVVAAVVAGMALLAWALSPDAFDELINSLELVGDGEDPFADPPDSLVAWFLAGFAAILVVGFLWEVLWVRSRGMGRPGQRIAGFRVVRASDLTRVGSSRAIGRAAAKLLYGIPNLGWLPVIGSAFTIGLSARRQGLHDMISGTACVKTSALELRGKGPDRLGTSGAVPGSGPFM